MAAALCQLGDWRAGALFAFATDRERKNLIAGSADVPNADAHLLPVPSLISKAAATIAGLWLS